MHKFYNNKLPLVFTDFFTPINQVHNYKTSKSSYYLSKARTNYGIFNIRYQGAKLWNSINEDIKLLSTNQFKRKIHEIYLKY